MKTKQNDNLLKILRALGEEARLDIILLLTSGEKCVCEIFENLKLPQNLVSHHLGILRENHLVKVNRDGKWIYYSLNRKKLKGLYGFIEKIISTKETKSKC